MVIGLGLVTTPLLLLNPYLTKLVIDKAYGEKDLQLFFILAAIGGTVFIVNGVIGSLTQYLSRYINRNVHFDMTADFFGHMQKLPLSFYNNHSTGEHIYRLNSDVRSVSEFVCNTIPQIVTLFPRIIFILILVFHLNWKLAVFATLLVPVTYIHPFFFGKWLRDINRHTILRSQGIFRGLQEVFSHMHLIKAMGKEGHELKKFEDEIEKRKEIELENARVSNIGTFSGSLINKALSGAIALYGGYQVIKGTITLGSLMAVMIYVTQLIGLLKSIGGFYQTITINSVTRHRLIEILDIKPTICDGDNARPHIIEKGKIMFEGLTFGYKKRSPVLNGLNFTIPAGTKAAIAGLSGSGKTTILSLILRLYKQEAGAIRVDGVDIRDITLDSLKGHMGIALQEPFLWNDSIKNNIMYGGEGATMDDVVWAAKMACAHDFISVFPNGYDSVIGEMACKLSEGQKQRIAVARAVIRRPKILILDEAMSSLDSETEDKVIENIRREFSDSTVLCVSHRVSAVKKMDSVYFLENGTSMHIGRHDELVTRVPRYRELFASQLEARSGSGIEVR